MTAKPLTIEVKYGRTIQPAPYESANASVGFTLQFDPEAPGADLDAEIEAALTTCVSHVSRTLGLKQPVAASKPVVQASGDLPPPANDNQKPKAEKAKAAKPAKAKPASPSDDPFDAPKQEQKQAAASDDPFDAPEQEQKPAYTRGDVNAAIQQALERLQKKGVSDGPAQITKKVRAYLPGSASPPYSSNKVPEGSLADFISDLNKLGR